MTSPWQEIFVPNGELQLAVRVHGDSSAPPILALHGWRDNAATFELLAPQLPDAKIIALDLPGHGLSSPRHIEGNYYIWSYVADVLHIVDTLNLTSFSLLGHSMGGAIATLFTALFPERVKNLILLDAVGPLVTPAHEAPAQMLRSLRQLQTLKPGYHHHYPDFMAAVKARADKGLSMDAATILGKRGIRHDERGYYWNLDPRLSRANLLSLTEEQVAAFIRKITCATLLITARKFWEQKLEWLALRCSYLQNLQTHELDGNHHQHLDGEVEAVGELIRKFIAAQ
ncbi:MAG: alpha/beta hydrolase [Pseudomonadota bacterium]